MGTSFEDASTALLTRSLVKVEGEVHRLREAVASLEERAHHLEERTWYLPSGFNFWLSLVAEIVVAVYFLLLASNQEARLKEVEERLPQAGA